MNTQLLYFYTNWSSFVEKDIKILQKNHSLIKFEFNPKKKWLTPLIFLKQFLFILKNYRKNSIFVVQFSGYHAFLPCLFAKLLNKKSLIIAGGTDCVAFPSISYGNLRSNLLGKFTRWSYQLAKMISPVDESLVLCSYEYQNNDGKNQGIKAHIPNLSTPIHVIYNGYDRSFQRLNKVNKNTNLFISVASGIESQSRFELKGIDMVFFLANKFPNKQFKVIGAQKVPQKIPVNVQLLPFVPNNELITHYNEAQYYLQLSLSEGFPNSLCEAMQCGCIPIVSNVGAMAHIIGNSGFILKEKNEDKLIKIIHEALSSDLDKLSFMAEKQINDNFSLEIREIKLLNLLNPTFPN